MSAKVSNIARNTSYYTLALVIQKVISFSYFVIIARFLGPEDLGKYYFAISFTTIAAIFIDLGLTNVLTRETAKNQADAARLINNSLSLKLPLAGATVLVVAILINLLGYPELTRHLVYFSSISMVLDSFTFSFFSISRGFHNLTFESVASVVFQLIVLGSGLLAMRFGLDVRALMAGLALASIFNFFYSAGVLKRKWRIRLRPEFDRALLKKIIAFSLPFAAVGIFQRFYTYFDSVLLSLLSGDREVGIYQVAFKVIFALQFLPAAFSASLYPALSTYWANNRAQLAITFERAMNYLLIISLPIAIGIASIADRVVLLFKAGYGGAALPLQISMAALVFLFLNYAAGAMLAACDRQKTIMYVSGAVTVASVALNLILIPRLAAVGASITVAATNFLMFAANIYYAARIVRFNFGKVGKMLAKVAAAAILMGAAAYCLKPYLNVFLTVGIAGVLYFSLLFLFGGFRKEDIVSILESFKKKETGEEKIAIRNVLD